LNAASGIFTVPAGSSIVISVKADIKAGVSGQIVGVSLTGVTASIPVSAVYPVSGASMSVFNATDIATATSTLVSTTGGSIAAGSLNQTLWSTSFDLATRAVYLKSLALKVIGSVPQDSLQNVKLYVAGIQVASAAGMDSNGMITFDLTAAPYKIDSSRTIEVRADVVNGSSRTFSISLQNASDLQVIDSNYNVGITVALKNAQSNGTFTVTTGSVILTQDSSLAAGNIVTGASNVPLARYSAKAYGEDMKISYLYASSTDQLDNVSLYANGVQIGSTKTISATATPVLFSLGQSLIIKAGQTVTLEIRADIKYNGTNATTTTNTIRASLIGYTSNTQGSYSQQLSTVPSATVPTEGVLMTVVGAGLTVAKNSTFNTISVPGTANVMIGSYTLQANSSEAIRITSITANVGGDIVATTSLSNLYVSVDGVSATPVGQVQTSNNFSVDFTVAANTTKIVNIYADINSNTGTATTSLSVNGYGVGSNITIAPAAAPGQSLTVGTGVLVNPTLANTSPDAQLVIGNSTAKIVDYRFASNYGSSIITDLDFTVAGKISEITVGGKTTPVVVGSTTTISGLSLVVPVGYSGLTVPVIVKYAQVGYGYENSLGTSSITITGYKFTSGNNTTATTSLSVASRTMVIVASKPTITLSSPAETIVYAGGTKTLARVTVAADAAGNVSLIDLPIKIVTTSGSVITGLNLQVGGVTKTATFSSTTVSASANVTIGITSITGTGGYEVTPGSPVVFDIVGTVALAAVTDSIQTSIASSTSGFVWKDIGGDATTTGAFIYNFPTNSATISNN